MTELAAEAEAADTNDLRIFARYFAKSVDVTLMGLPIVLFASLLVGVVIGVLFPAWFETTTPTIQNLIFTAYGVLVAILFYPIVEAVCISRLGNTPGKALMGIRVMRVDGSRPDFSTALSRAYRSYIQGMGGGVPLVALMMMI